jgi:hypothetical protein
MNRHPHPHRQTVPWNAPSEIGAHHRYEPSSSSFPELSSPPGSRSLPPLSTVLLSCQDFKARYLLLQYHRRKRFTTSKGLRKIINIPRTLQPVASPHKAQKSRYHKGPDIFKGEKKGFITLKEKEKKENTR